MAAKKGLGKGLDALFLSNEVEDENADSIKSLRISNVEPDKNQPRKVFVEEKLSELTESIKQHGVITPIIVRDIGSGRYCIIAGERRWRASRRAGLTEIPAVVRDYTPQEIREISLIENLQREDLNIIEEALGYKTLIEEHNLAQNEVAKIIGKSSPFISNTLRLLNLPENILEMVKNNSISAGHAKVLLSVEDKEHMFSIANKIVNEDLSVRETEKRIKLLLKPKKPQENKELDVDTRDLEKQVSENLGVKVKISKNKNKGKIELEFYNEDDLSKLIDILTTSKI